MNRPINLPVSAKSIPARGDRRATPVGGERGPLAAIVPLASSGINDPKVARARVSKRVIYELLACSSSSRVRMDAVCRAKSPSVYVIDRFLPRSIKIPLWGIRRCRGHYAVNLRRSLGTTRELKRRGRESRRGTWREKERRDGREESTAGEKEMRGEGRVGNGRKGEKERGGRDTDRGGQEEKWKRKGDRNKGERGITEGTEERERCRTEGRGGREGMEDRERKGEQKEDI